MLQFTHTSALMWHKSITRLGLHPLHSADRGVDPRKHGQHEDMLAI